MKTNLDPPRLDTSDDEVVRRALTVGRGETPDEKRLARLASGVSAKIAVSNRLQAVKVFGGMLAAGAILTGGYVALTAHSSPNEVSPTVDAATMEDAAPVTTASSPPVPRAITIDDLPVAPKPTSNLSFPSIDASIDAIDAGGASETSLLRDAQDALKTDPARTLSLCEEHRTRFPNGMFAQEREVLAVDALLRLGRTDEAQQRAAAFEKTYPSSGYGRRLDSLLGQ